MMGSIPIR